MERFKKIKDINVLVYGDFMVDNYIHGSVTRISPEAPVPVLQVESKLSKLGGAGNVVNNIISLGASVKTLGGVGKDVEGQWIIDELRIRGIETRYVQQFMELQTISKTRLVSRNHQLLRYDEENVNDMPHEYLKYLEENEEDIFQGIHIVVISDYGKGTVIKSIAQFLIKAARARSISVVVDPKGKDYSKYMGASVCTPNTKELGDVIGEILNTEEDLEKAGKRVRKSVQLENLLLTRSEKGISLFDNMDNKKDFPAASKDVVDVTGAGDTVVATVALLMVAGFSMEECCVIANIAASIVCSKFGASTLSLNELMQQIEHQGNNSIYPNKVFKNINQVGYLDKQIKNYKADGIKPIILERKKGRKIVFTNGCFDILHTGHVKYLQSAKQLGDCLVVGINSDSSVRKLKGITRPINSLEDRMDLLAALESVHYVVGFEEDTPLELIRAVMPDVLVKGGDYKVEDIVGAELVISNGGIVTTIPFVEGKSTTRIIQSIQDEVIR